MNLFNHTKSELIQKIKTLSNQIRIDEELANENSLNLLKRFDLASEELTEVVWEFFPDSGIIEWNDKVEAVYHLQANKLSSFEKWTKVVYPDDLDKVLGLFKLALRTKKIQEIDFRIELTKGEIRLIHGTILATFDDNGELHSYIGTNRDITNVKVVEERIRSTNNRLRLAIETMAMAIWEIDASNNNIKWDGDVKKIYQYSEKQLSTISKWARHIVPEDIELVKVKMQEAAALKSTQMVEFRIVKPDRTIGYINSSIMPIYNELGELQKYIGINNDITTEKENKIRLELVKKELEKSNTTLKIQSEKLQYYFDTLSAIVVSLNKEGIVVTVNKSACELFGYEREEMIGKDYLKNFLPSITKEKTIDIFHQIMNEKKSEKDYLENWVLCKDGTKRLISWKTSYSRDEQGEVIGTISYGEDITFKLKEQERFRLLKELAETANESQSLKKVMNMALYSICRFTNWPLGHVYYLANKNKNKLVSSGIWHVNSDTQYIDLQEVTALCTFKYGEGLPGLAWKEKRTIWTKDHDIKEGFEREEVALLNGLVGGFAFPIVVNDNEVFILEFFYKELLGFNQELIEAFVAELGGMLGALIERESFQNELKYARKAAENASKAKTKFLANMSHELRTPMNAILGHAQILERNKNLDENQLKSIQTIYKSGEHLLGIINEVLNMSKIERGEMELKKSTFSLREMLEDLVDMFEFDLKKKGISINLRYIELLPDFIIADENKIKQVLINLVGNAIKFSERGTILIATEFENNIISLSVSDSGIGISKKDLKKIFKSFEQAEGGLLKGGTGLGLSISRNIAKMMGGSLEVESQKGIGSKFTFQFPFELWGFKIKSSSILRDEISSKKNNLLVTKNVLAEEGQNHKNVEHIMKKMMSKVDSYIKDDFKEAIGEGDIERLTKLTENIKKSNKELYQLLQSDIEAIELEKLRNLFN